MNFVETARFALRALVVNRLRSLLTMLGIIIGIAAVILLMLDLLPGRRGAVMSASTFVTLVFNAVSAAVVAPYAGRSVLGFALAAAVSVVLGWACWQWHLVAGRRAAAAVSLPG